MVDRQGVVVAEMRDNEKENGIDRLLQRPIDCLLPGNDPQEAARLSRACETQGLLLKSLNQLFEAEYPPMELLLLVRDFGKQHLASLQSPLSKPAARVIYLAALATALVRNRENASSLDPVELARQFGWAAQQPGLSQNLQQTFDKAGKLLAGQHAG